MRYPDAARSDVVDDLHGHRVADPYRWLEDPSIRATREWMRAQDVLATELLAALPLRGEFAAAPGAAGARGRGRGAGLAR